MSVVVTDQVAIVRESYGRCLLVPGFLDLFYERFLDKSPLINEMFKHTDMKRQKKVLRTGISNMISFAQDKPTGKIAIEKLSVSHNRKNLDVNPNMYRFWLIALLETLKATDPKWTNDLKYAWRDVVSKGVQVIASAY